jgi:hypothetical protein
MGNGPGWSRPERAGAGHAVEILWAATWAAHRGEKQSQTRPVGEFRPMANRKMRKAFYFSNLL